MNINTSELRRFYDVWGPMITSLPAVINAAETQSELAGHVERLKTELAGTVAETEKSLAARKAGFAAIEAQLQELTAKKREQTLSAKAHEKACVERIAEATANANTAVAEQESRAAAARKQAEDAEASLKLRLAEADAKVVERLAGAEAELEALEKRKAAAEKALDALRAKLG